MKYIVLLVLVPLFVSCNGSGGGSGISPQSSSSNSISDRKNIVNAQLKAELKSIGQDLSGTEYEVSNADLTILSEELELSSEEQEQLALLLQTQGGQQ